MTPRLGRYVGLLQRIILYKFRGSNHSFPSSPMPITIYKNMVARLHYLKNMASELGQDGMRAWYHKNQHAFRASYQSENNNL